MEYRIPVGDMVDMAEVEKDEVPGNPYRVQEDVEVENTVLDDAVEADVITEPKFESVVDDELETEAETFAETAVTGLKTVGKTAVTNAESVVKTDIDEPINGLDPQGIAEVRDTIQRLQKERNMTICISSHILEELSKIATDYGIIHNGSLLQELTRDELMRRCSERMELTLDDPKRAIPVLDAMGFTSYQVTDKEHIHIFERLSESASLNMELAKAGIPVKGISITSEELEAYFLNLTGGASHA